MTVGNGDYHYQSQNATVLGLLVIRETRFIDNCLPLTAELFRQLAFCILSCKPISYCRFKRIDVYIL